MTQILYTPVLTSNRERSSPVAPDSNFPAQETSNYGETGLPVLLRVYGYCNGGFPTEELSGWPE